MPTDSYLESVTVGPRVPHNGTIVLEKYDPNWPVDGKPSFNLGELYMDGFLFFALLIPGAAVVVFYVLYRVIKAAVRDGTIEARQIMDEAGGNHDSRI